MNARDRQSVVLITVDCLRADHTGFGGYRKPTTPFLDQLATESLLFPNAVATGAPTYYSFPGLLASRFPLGLGREVVGIAPGEPTLATVLQQAGYKTAAFVAANPYLSPRFGYEQGFDVFRDFFSDGASWSNGDHERTRQAPRAATRLNRQIATAAHKLTTLGKLYDELYFQYCQRMAAGKNETWESLRRFPAADVLVDESCSWLATTRQPFFLWLHFMDPHAPYYPPAQALEAVGAGHLQPARGRYLNASWNRGDIGRKRLSKHRDEIVCLHDAAIRWVDMQVARLVEFLRGSPLWDSCVFVLTADHGEEFLEHGGHFHPPSRPYQELLHVPLLVRVPGVQKKQLTAAPFSQIHLAPTILCALGIEPPEEFEGRSYWREVKAGGGWEMAFSESVGTCTNPMEPAKRVGGRLLAVQDERYKLVLDFERGAEELYDLPADPTERQILLETEERKARARLLQAALEHLQRRAGHSKTGLALAAKVRQLGLEWSHPKNPAEPAT